MAARKAKQVLENANTAASANASARPAFSGCPGSMSRFLKRTESAPSEHDDTHADSAETFNPSDSASIPVSALQNWPVQIKLAPIHAPYFDGAKLLVAADCTAYAYSRFHQDFIHGKITLIGCPKLDSIDYSEKLTEIIRSNDIKSVTVVRMEVPCCGDIEQAVKNALQASGKFIPWQVTTISIDGRILD